jgi:hypothetical protein
MLVLAIVVFPVVSAAAGQMCSEPCVPGSEDIMQPKAHGTSEYPVQESLRWNCDWDTADRICNYNRYERGNDYDYDYDDDHIMAKGML